MDIKYKFRVSWSMGNILIYLALWILLGIVTLGVAFFFAPYAWAAKMLNGCEVYDREGKTLGILKVDLDIADQIVHIIVWYIVSILTLGLATPFYFLGVGRTVLDNTQIVDPFRS